MVSIVTPDFAVGLLDFSQDVTGDNGQNLFNNPEITDLSIGLLDFSQDVTGDNGQNLFNNPEITDLSIGLLDFSQDVTGDDGQNLFNNACNYRKYSNPILFANNDRQRSPTY
ncbi:MAG: hypothetical protein KME55_18890 [Nostoc indistinguendum CM1-VF10]|jgi:hypothetical protein|nr:hypothetical protein [Nostoc indistinguendum CM1-VF10]